MPTISVFSWTPRPGSTGMSFVELGSTTRLYAALHARGFCRQMDRRIEAVWSSQICMDQLIVHCHQIRSEARGEAGIVGGGVAGLVGGLIVIFVVDLICYRCVLLVQLLDHLLEVSVDAGSQVLLV